MQEKKQIPASLIPTIIARIRALVFLDKWEDSITRAEKACDLALRQIENMKIQSQ